MFGQITVNVLQAKFLIAQAILKLPEVEYALQHGKVVLKSGTTVNLLANQLGLPAMRLGGRITRDGARAAKSFCDAPHIIVIDKGIWRSADSNLSEELSTMGQNDIFITGANALDTSGMAGILAGIEAGSTLGKSISLLWSEGIQTIIAVGLEKLIPGSIQELCKRPIGRKKIELSMGMAVGLLPLFGKIISEKEAIEILTGVHSTVIAAGGILGAEGATTMIIEGETTQVEQTLKLVCENTRTLNIGDQISLVSCDSYGSACDKHLGCIYRKQHNR